MMEAAPNLPLWSRIYDVLMPPPKMTCADWARAYRVLDRRWSRYPGPWQSSRTPYLDGPMEAFSNPMVRKITMCTPTQMGKTEAMMNMLGYAVAIDPGTGMWVQARGADSRRTLNRLKALSASTPVVKEQRDKNERHDQTLWVCQYRNMALWLASSRSPASMAQVPCRYVWCDEVDKWQRWSGEESDPVELASRRTDSYSGIETVVLCSTPTTEDGFIWQSLESSHRLAFYVPCPRCETWQQLIWGSDVEHGVTWPGGRGADIEELIAKDLVKYKCCECGALWGDFTRRQAVKKGVWCDAEQPAGRKVEPDPLTAPHLGFQWSRLYSTTNHTLAQFVGMWLDAQGFPEKLMAFMNNVLAEPWVEVVTSAKWNKLLERCHGYRMGEVPAGVQVMTIGVDVHEDDFRYAIRGWGHGESTWLIAYGSLPFERGARDWQRLAQLVLVERQSEDGRVVMPSLCMVDSGFVPEEVYAFARMHPHVVRATKGTEQLAGPWRQSNLKRVGGVLWLVKPSIFKEYLHTRLTLDPGQPGAWHFPEGTGDDYFRELCSHRKERVTQKRTGVVRYEWRRKQGVPDHWLDCELQNCVAAKMCNVAALPVSAIIHQQKQPQARDHGDWIGAGEWSL